MATRVLVGLICLGAIIEGIVPGMVPQGLLPLVLVILGILYGIMAVDAEKGTHFLVVVVAVNAAAQADALTHIHMIGSQLDAILGWIGTSLYGAVAAIIAISAWNRLKGEMGE